jgi:hypothetical protein
VPKGRELPPVELDDYAMYLLKRGLRDEFFEHITLLALNPDIEAIRNNPPHLYLQPMHVKWIYDHAHEIQFWRNNERDRPFDWEHSWRPRHDPRRPIPLFADQVQGLYLIIWNNLRYWLNDSDLI